MAVLLASLAAVFSGTGDFLGGVAARKGRVMAVVAASHLVGIATTFFVAPIVGGDPTAADLWWGAVAGASGGLGILALYLGLSKSDVGIVSPIAAVGAAGWPVLFAVATGERPSFIVWLGVFLGVVAIWMVSRSNPGRGTAIGRGVTMGMLAGVGFGGLLIALSEVGEGAGIWPLAPARTAGFAVVAAVALASSQRIVPLRSSILPMAGAGAATILGNGSFILATQEGSLAVVSVVAAMFPVTTVILARMIWKEHFSRTRLIGLGIALVAVALVAVG
ncbi:MAG: DMT family transporter [Acidimicrobiia bacterium]|nr:DMT family transporter [Acidimicrobiia bacterium]